MAVSAENIGSVMAKAAKINGISGGEEMAESVSGGDGESISWREP